MISEKSTRMSEKESCPYISEPSNECYFQKMDSRSIESALTFCLHDYTKCRIFESLFFLGASSDDLTSF